MVPNPMYPAKKSENKKSVQVFKHWVSNVLIFQCRMTAAQSNSKGERVKHPSFQHKEKEFNNSSELQGICVLQCLIVIILNLHLHKKPFSLGF
jgi:hypothetical protein